MVNLAKNMHYNDDLWKDELDHRHLSPEHRKQLEQNKEREEEE